MDALYFCWSSSSSPLLMIHRNDGERWENRYLVFLVYVKKQRSTKDLNDVAKNSFLVSYYYATR
jgi:hypothetical protein